MLEWLRFGIAASLIAVGTFMMVSSVIGVYRFRYVLNRMHAAALADTMGILFIVLGLCVASGLNWTSLKFLLLVVIWWQTSPVAGHLITRLEVATNPALEKEMSVITEDAPQREVER